MLAQKRRSLGFFISKSKQQLGMREAQTAASVVFVSNAESRGPDSFPNAAASVPFHAEASAQPVAFPAIAVY